MEAKKKAVNYYMLRKNNVCSIYGFWATEKGRSVCVQKLRNGNQLAGMKSTQSHEKVEHAVF